MNKLWKNKRKEIGDAAQNAILNFKPKKDWEIGVREFRF